MELSITLHEPGTGERPVVTVANDGRVIDGRVVEGIAVHGLDRQTNHQIAFTAFYTAHHQSVARALGLSLGDADLGCEAADEAMTRACQRWADVSEYQNPEGWVYRVGLNWARSRLRRLRRLRSSPHLEDLPIFDPPPADPSLAAALAALDDKHRAVVVLRYYMDWSVEATADALNIKAGTVKSRLSRALKQLHQRLGSLHD